MNFGSKYFPSRSARESAYLPKARFQRLSNYPIVRFRQAESLSPIMSVQVRLRRDRFNVSNMIHGLDETILRQADNLFLLHIPCEDDVRHYRQAVVETITWRVVWPMRIVSPSCRWVGRSMRAPFRNVPLLLPRSARA